MLMVLILIAQNGMINVQLTIGDTENSPNIQFHFHHVIQINFLNTTRSVEVVFNA